MRRNAAACMFPLLALVCGAANAEGTQFEDEHLVVLRHEAGTARFVVPKFVTLVAGSMFELHLRYPAGTPYQPSRIGRHSVRVLVLAAPSSRAESRRLIAQPYRLSGKQGPFNVYEATLPNANGVQGGRATTYATTDTQGRLLTVNDPGSWSKSFSVSRTLSTGVELEYQFSKELGLEAFPSVDRMVLAALASMEAAANARRIP